MIKSSDITKKSLYAFKHLKLLSNETVIGSVSDYPLDYSGGLLKFSRSFLSLIAVGDKFFSDEFNRNKSNPPFLSTVRSAAAETLNLKVFSSFSDVKETIFKFGKNRRFVLFFAWLTLLPVRAILPVSSHRLDIFLSLCTFLPWRLVTAINKSVKGPRIYSR